MLVTRFAPSPIRAAAPWTCVQRSDRDMHGHGNAGGKFRLRIEDLDQTRCRPEFVDGIYRGPRWLGVEWDEPVLVQSERTAAYEAALERAQITKPGLRLLLHPLRHRPVADCTARRCRDVLSRHLPRSCPTIPSAVGQRRTAGVSILRKRCELTGLPTWVEADGRSFTTRRATSATRSSLARMRRPPTISAASSMMPRAA